MDYTTISSASLTSNVITVVVASLVGLRVGDHVTVAGVNTQAQPHFDGTHTLTAVTTTTVGDVTTYSVSWSKNHANIVSFDCDGRLTPLCTWIDSGQVEGFLGVAPANIDDDAFLASSVDAGNEWAYRRRQSAGYDDWYSVCRTTLPCSAPSCTPPASTANVVRSTRSRRSKTWPPLRRSALTPKS